MCCACGQVPWSECLYLPRIHVLKSQPQAMVSGSGAFGRCLGHEGEGPQDQGFYKGGPTEPPSLLPHEDAGKDASLNQEEGLH